MKYHLVLGVGSWEGKKLFCGGSGLEKYSGGWGRCGSLTALAPNLYTIRNEACWTQCFLGGQWALKLLVSPYLSSSEVVIFLVSEDFYSLKIIKDPFHIFVYVGSVYQYLSYSKLKLRNFINICSFLNNYY